MERRDARTGRKRRLYGHHEVTLHQKLVNLNDSLKVLPLPTPEVPIGRSSTLYIKKLIDQRRVSGQVLVLDVSS